MNNLAKDVKIARTTNTFWGQHNFLIEEFDCNFFESHKEGECILCQIFINIYLKLTWCEPT